MDTRRIRGRVVEIEAGEAAGIGCVAVGVVRGGLPHEVGMRFEAKGGDADEARRLLEAEIEAYFS
ncbi:MAG: hypothetical protein HYR51_03975 [Candidatus Rokubacteria bacterium]|nr:hypothetical protein [Candidatus Rokubacteria bacterium]